MAYFNGKATCFSPSMILEGRNAVLQELKVNDMPNGDVTIYPDEGFDGFSAVTAMGAYFTENDDMYTRVMRMRKGDGMTYSNCPHLEKIIFDRGISMITIHGYDNNAALKEIEFSDNCLLTWEYAAFYNSPIETIRFGAIASDSLINIWGGFADTLTNVTNVELMAGGWQHDLAFYCSPLTVESLQNIINQLGTATNGQTLWLGEENLAKLSSDYIDAATAKGWSLM